MSDMGGSNSNNGPGGNPTQHGGQANFDNTTGPGNRDAWNRLIKQDTKNNQGNNDKSDGTDDNNGGVDDDLVANIWDKIENTKGGDGNKGGGGNNNNSGGGNNNTNTQVDETAQLQKYLKNNGLGGINITEAEKEAASNGDYGPLMANINGYVVNSHMKSLSGSQTMIQKAVKDAVAEVMNKANANYAGHKNLDAMHEALPFTKEKHIAPVAASVLQKFLDRGMDTEKAVKGVEAYFSDISSRVGGNSVNKNRNSNFNSGDKKQNWLTVLSPGN